jgi:drug/metabolite transporter (DMT)-like permease
MDVLRKNFGYVALAGVGAGIGTTFVNLGYATGDIGIVSAIAGAQALIAMIFAHYFYQERLTRLQYGGAGLVLLGIALAAMI